jgi:hypothetical protein
MGNCKTLQILNIQGNNIFSERILLKVLKNLKYLSKILKGNTMII